MEAVAMESFTINKDRRRRKPSNGHVVARLLEAPLPTPRRSSSADAPPVPRRASAADASPPQRRHVPFGWESAPGVPKSSAAEDRGVTPPKPPPGRRSCGGAGTPRRENTTAAATDGTSEDVDTFSDAMDRASSSDRLALAALSARLSSIDGAGSRRAPSFIMARFLPAANAVADKQPRRSPSPQRRRRVRRSNDEEAAAARARARQVMMNAPRVCALDHEQPKHQQRSPSPPPRQNIKDAAAELSPRVDEEASAERACGLMFFFPWRSKPVLLRFPRTSSRSRASNASVAASVTAPSPSPPRRSVTLGDILEKDRRLRDGGDLSRRWCEEENNGGSGKEWSGLGWGAGLLSTSKRYCADAARKALSRLARSATDGGAGGLRVCRERKNGKWQVASEVGSTPDMMPPLSPPSESWLSHARRSNASRGIDVSQIELM
ncbi:hypothetical protein PR202_gb01538 [Eleusine coracana subsp. coracana]|uniref:Uncharacterized protein n=1 Tax=Eleusine coracana subsp. coracana TaxID=191504 RepID=A0AAV5DUM7_ELECO|nr:hypothetical protein QOZ80_5BG0417390 [Eleusine coracana subsp. coracana]GJN14683.1 hypothetical protein PR202_gb01538 [Eleusine coracana subsp. coracana]